MENRQIRRILVVDDFLMIRTMTKEVLKLIGFEEVDEAVNGVEAFQKLEEALNQGKGFDMVITDWNMPEMDGMELLEKCRGDERFSRVAFIMITAETEQTRVFRAIKAGATDYIVKPITKSDLEKKLDIAEQWLSKQAA